MRKRPREACRTVTCNDQEFIIVRNLMGDHVREGSDNLLLGREICALLEFEIANCTGQCKVAIDTAKVDKTSGGTDPCLLAWKSLA